MPWTFAHPAAVIPFFLRWPSRLSLSALVIGSVAPDFGYYIGRFDLAKFAHTPLGLLSACLPMALASLALMRALRSPVINLLPQPHRSALLSLPQLPRLWSFGNFWRCSVSIGIGSLTHVAWDSFTHGSGYAVAHVAVLRQPLFTLLGRMFHLYNVLQHVSTFVGVVVIVAAYTHWVRRASVQATVEGARGDVGKYLILVIVALISIVAAIPFAYVDSTAKFEGMNVSLFTVRMVIYTTTLFAIVLPIVAMVLDSRTRH